MDVEFTPLQLGIAAIKAQNNEEARKQLIQAISLDPEDAEPWLWLGVVALNLEERVQYMEQAITLQPDNTRALKLLDTLRKQCIEIWVQNGISSVKEGNITLGVQLLTKAVTMDDTQLEAWWWLGQSLEEPEDKAVCFENVLTLDPDHQGALLALQALKQIEAEKTLDLSKDDQIFTNSNHKANLNNSIRAETVQDNASPLLISGILPEKVPSNKDLNNVQSCPFCAAKTVQNDQKCPQCERRLYKRQRLVTRPKPQYRILIALESSIFLGGILVILLILGLIDMVVESSDLSDIIRAYLGLVTPNLSTGTDVAFAIISPLAFNISLVPSLIAVLIIICIISRWQPLYFTAVGLSTIRIFFCILDIILVTNTLSTSASFTPEVASGLMLIKPTSYGLWGAIVLVGVLSARAMFLLINLHDHFLIKKTRRLLQLDDDIVGSSAGLRQRARLYAKEKAWALAALHARESLVSEQEVEGYTLLATAYYHLGWHENVSATINDALATSPDNTQLIELREVLEQQMEQNDAVLA